jgi:hypothetical protein
MGEWPKEWIRGRDDVLRELKLWEGANAQGWAYTISHAQFLVRLHREEDLKRSPPRSFYLYLKDCHRVSFSGSWLGANIQIEEKKGKFGPEYFVSDGERLFIHCGYVFAAESSQFLRFEAP